MIALPSQEEGDELVAGSTDMWGNPIEYETDGFSFSLRSPGQDGIPDTEDDVVTGPFADPESAKAIRDGRDSGMGPR